MRGQAGEAGVKKCGLLCTGPLGEGAAAGEADVRKCGLPTTGPLGEGAACVKCGSLSTGPLYEAQGCSPAAGGCSMPPVLQMLRHVLNQPQSFAAYRVGQLFCCMQPAAPLLTWLCLVISERIPTQS